MIPMEIIARIRSDFPTKFGIPRQSGLVEELRARVVFEPEYRNPDALRGLEDFSHIWLIWQFSQAVREGWSPTVRPPRLGGNARMGVFATRSPFRPNPVGLSCVRLERVEWDAPDGPALVVAGADPAAAAAEAEPTKEDVVVTFLAILELMKVGAIEVRQSDTCGDIEVQASEGVDDAKLHFDDIVDG